MRLFFALTLNSSWLKTISEFVHIHKSAHWAKKLHWVPENNWHLTLRFLGHVELEQVHLLAQKVQAALINSESFFIEANKIELFPAAEKPHVLALMIEPNGELLRLVDALEMIAREMGFAPERQDYRGHVTIARCPQHHFIELPEMLSIHLPPLEVKECTLMQSELNEHQQRVYIPLQKIKF